MILSVDIKSPDKTTGVQADLVFAVCICLKIHFRMAGSILCDHCISSELHLSYTNCVGLQRYIHDKIHIAILASRYNMYSDTLFRLEIISNCMRIILRWSTSAHHTQSFFEMVHSPSLSFIFVKFSLCEKFIPLLFLQRTEPIISIQVQVLKLPRYTMFKNRFCPEYRSIHLIFSGARFIDLIESHYCKISWKNENSMKESLTTLFWVFWVLLIFITMFNNWII